MVSERSVWPRMMTAECFQNVEKAHRMNEQRLVNRKYCEVLGATLANEKTKHIDRFTVTLTSTSNFFGDLKQFPAFVVAREKVY